MTDKKGSVLESLETKQTIIVDPVNACAIHGAYQVCLSCKDIIPLIHGTAGCPCIMWLTMVSTPTFLGLSELRFPCTSLSKSDIVYGGERKLEENILEVKEAFDPRLIMVIASCTASIIGDDINMVAARMSKKCNIPILAVDTRSSHWDQIEGRIHTQSVLIRNIMEDRGVRKENGVNIVGLSAGDYNWRGDLAELKRMLNAIGVEVNSAVSAASTLEEIRHAPDASLNIVVSSEYGLEAAKEMEKLFNIPYLDLLPPYGIRCTEDWVYAVADRMGVDKREAESFVKREAKEAADYIVPQFTSFGQVRLLRGIPTALFGNASQIAAIARYITRELGMKPVLIGLKAFTPISKAQLDKVREELDLEYELLEEMKSIEDMVTVLERVKVDYLFGSDIDRKVGGRLLKSAAFAGIASPIFFKINATFRPFMGFRGAVHLFEEIMNGRLELYQTERPYGSFWDLPT